jgi:hypothetical protein
MTRVWLFIGLFAFLGATYATSNVLSTLRLHRDERALRDAALACAPAETALRLEFSVGPWTLGLARCVTAFVELPPEARAALESVESAEVGVYKFAEAGTKASRLEMFTRAQAAMTARGWERIVGVLQEDHAVAVYTPSGLEGKRFKCCVLTVTPTEMIIAGAVTQLEPLVHIASRHLRSGTARR